MGFVINQFQLVCSLLKNKQAMDSISECLETRVRMVSRWSAGLSSSSWVIGLQLHGMVPGLILGTLWFLSACTRLRELRRLRRAGGAKSDWIKRHDLHQLPSVTVVLPVRGCRLHSISNWKSILEQDYDGQVEYIFVMESGSDSANAVICDIVQNPNILKHTKKTARTVFSGRATSCSQKIHNLIAGIGATQNGSKYVVCIDDDVQLHPMALSSLIADMEGCPECHVGTGYPFDIPNPKSNVLTYAALSYHLPLVIGLSLHTKTHFVWGGCMVFRAEDVSKDDKLGFLAAWADGGYSDDLILAARCTQLQLPILCPPHAIYPQWLDGGFTLRRYWNYLRRQLFVLDTYSSSHNRRTNHSLALLHCYGSWSFVLPCVLVFTRVVLWIFSFSVSKILHLSQLSLSSNSGEELYLKHTTSPMYKASVALFVISSLYMFVSLFFMMQVVLLLLSALNPNLDKARMHGWHFDWIRLIVGFWLSNAILPVCMVYTFATSHIEWSGIVYKRFRGKIVKVVHHPKGSSSRET